jgi:uncharacterized protein (DUF486 family)
MIDSLPERFGGLLIVFQTAVITAQTTMIPGSIFCSMYGTKLVSVANTNDSLGFSIDRTMTVHILFPLMARILLYFSLPYAPHLSPHLQGIKLAGFFFLITGWAILGYLIYRMLLFLNKQRMGYSFKDAEQMKCFYTTIALCIFVIGNIYLFINAGVIALNNKAVVDSLGDLNGFLYNQIALLVVLQVLKGRFFVRAVEIKTEKLCTRLSLMQKKAYIYYISWNFSFG